MVTHARRRRASSAETGGAAAGTAATGTAGVVGGEADRPNANGTAVAMDRDDAPVESELPKPHADVFCRVVTRLKSLSELPTFSVGTTVFRTPLFHMKRLKFPDVAAYNDFLAEAKSQWADKLENIPEEQRPELIPQLCRDFKTKTPEDVATLKRITIVEGIISYT